jgi:hypothetical protein
MNPAPPVMKYLLVMGLLSREQVIDEHCQPADLAGSLTAKTTETKEQAHDHT